MAHGLGLRFDYVLQLWSCSRHVLLSRNLYTFADSNSYTVFTIYLNDENDNPVADGTTITLSTTYGTVPDATTTTGECTSSWGRFRYYGSPTRRDDHCGDMLAQDAWIYGWADWSSSDALVHLEHNFCENTRSSIRMPGSIGSGGSFYASVNVRDQWNNPICGENVNILVTGGSVVGPATVATDNSGAALSPYRLRTRLWCNIWYCIVSAAFSACAVSGTVSITSSRLVSPRFGTDGDAPSSTPIFVPYEVPESIVPTLRKPENSGTARIFEPKRVKTLANTQQQM
jgi:hypothetical protein